MQYNKVEISGVNTNELKTLKESEKLELLKKAHSGDKKAREELIKELHYDENQELFKIIKEQYREAYGCVKMIYLMMEEEYKYAMTEDEMLYLTIHIQKITEDHKRLKNL